MVSCVGGLRPGQQFEPFAFGPTPSALPLPAWPVTLFPLSFPGPRVFVGAGVALAFLFEHVMLSPLVSHPFQLASGGADALPLAPELCVFCILPLTRPSSMLLSLRVL